MPPPRVLVIGETPSLGRAIVDLLESDGVRCRYALDLDPSQREDLRDIDVIIAAANTPYCATLRRQEQGLLNGHPLIVVGSRDPRVARNPKVHRIELPLEPAPFLRLVHSLVAQVVAFRD
jgi:hypothetical protein